MDEPAVARGDCVLVRFPLVTTRGGERKLRPALVVQSDRYNRRRAAVVIAAITTSSGHATLPSKVRIGARSAAGKAGGLRTDSVVDCQTLATVLRSHVVRVIGTLPARTMSDVDAALRDALAL